MWYRYSLQTNNNSGWLYLVLQDIFKKQPWLVLHADVAQIYQLFLAYDSCCLVNSKHPMLSSRRIIKQKPSILKLNSSFSKQSQFNKNARNFKFAYSFNVLNPSVSPYAIKLFVLAFSQVSHSLATSDLLILPVYKNLLLSFSGALGFSSFKFDLKLCFLHWCNSWNFLFNFFFTDDLFLSFGRPDIKLFVNSLNMTFWPYSLKELRSSLPIFTLQTVQYSLKYRRFVKHLVARAPGLFFFFDCQFHEKILVYLYNNHAVTMGLVNFSCDPWNITYPLLGFAINFSTIYILYLMILVTKRSALSELNSRYIDDLQTYNYLSMRQISDILS